MVTPGRWVPHVLHVLHVLPGGRLYRRWRGPRHTWQVGLCLLCGAALATSTTAAAATTTLTQAYTLRPTTTHTRPQVKSWNGNTAADGVLEGSRGYALMRRRWVGWVGGWVEWCLSVWWWHCLVVVGGRASLALRMMHPC